MPNWQITRKMLPFIYLYYLLNKKDTNSYFLHKLSPNLHSRDHPQTIIRSRKKSCKQPEICGWLTWMCPPECSTKDLKLSAVFPSSIRTPTFLFHCKIISRELHKTLVICDKFLILWTPSHQNAFIVRVSGREKKMDRKETFLKGDLVLIHFGQKPSSTFLIHLSEQTPGT